jgi:hsp70-interacting protein
VNGRLIHLDSDITVRRKAAFLINSLLIPSNTEADEVHQSSNMGSSTSNSAHPNSHVSMMKDPSSISTSEITLKALEDRGLLKGIISALTVPVPYGKDGESNEDVDFEEKILR